jgi:hypothetical protein
MLIEIPDVEDVSAYDMKMFIAAKLYEDGKLSSGHAAQYLYLNGLILFLLK